MMGCKLFLIATIMLNMWYHKIKGKSITNIIAPNNNDEILFTDVSPSPPSAASSVMDPPKREILLFAVATS